MPTINSVNNSLTGSTGTGSFVGSDSAVLTGTITTSNTFKIPNNAAPTITAGGHIAVDTIVTGFKPTLTYHNGSSSQSVVAVNAANLTTTNDHVIVYDSVGQQFKMQAPEPPANKSIVQYGFASLGANATTNSGSAVATGLTINITPTLATNKICCEIFCNIEAIRASSVIVQRYGLLYLVRTVSGTPTTLTTTNIGKAQTSGSSSNNASLLPCKLYYEEVPGSTTQMTYSLSYSSPSGSMSFTVFSGSFIFVYELEV